MGKVLELVVGKDNQVRGAKLKVNSATGEPTICHRPVQKLLPFEIITKERSLNSQHENEPVIARPTRKAAIEGQTIRRLKEKYF